MKVTSAPHRLVWTLVDVGQSGVAVAERDALGTTARIAVWPREHLAAALGAVDARLERLDREASRFRSDSEISCVERAGGGIFFVSEGLAEAIAVALATARWTDGLVDPTVGGALIALGYDRDFATIDPAGDPTAVRPEAVPGWRSARLEGRLLHLPAGVRLDLGATAKGLGSDRAARAALDSMGHRGGVLVSLGGDIAIAGQPPRDGWPILVTDDHRSPDASTAQVVRLTAGAVATSSVVCRQWRRGSRVLHHIVDPRTGLPADGPWRSASVAARSCAEANGASTAAIVAGADAEDWLGCTALPARLVAHDGAVRHLGGWPERDGGRIDIGRRGVSLGARPGRGGD